ncbi:MAG TPA: tRNA (adenosine(37)-N6)-threonylcarbamoyltransferase complex ATPase subunit type 1 TsaE [Bacilli bacterium]|nr:tRNA (adenosine(37)-N6)-threonylcarbamoyltransferase complex ATPase subunit type 1 TsaE [Bacilli bacterium]
MKIKKIIANEQMMINLGQIIGEHAQANMVIALNGNLGVGKTTLTKGIALDLGIRETINSPTYTILKIYKGRLPLYHLDLYRTSMGSGDEDLAEYFEQGGLCVVEWANNIAHLLPANCLTITFFVLSNGARQVDLSTDNPAFNQMLGAIK